MGDYINLIFKNVDLNKPQSLNEIVYEGVKKVIINGEIPIGERINEKELASRLNISRTPVREAIKRLKAEQLVEYIPRYGVIVKKISPEDVEEIYKIRYRLDSLASLEAMKHMTEVEYQQFYRLLEETEQLLKEGNMEKTIHLFSVFNEKIYKESKLLRLESIVFDLREYLKRFRDISLNDRLRCEKALEEHYKIIQLMEKGETKMLEKVLKDHLEYSKKFILIELEKIS